jgi:hypothetical protein
LRAFWHGVLSYTITRQYRRGGHPCGKCAAI